MPTGAPMSTTSRVFASDLQTSSSQPCPPELETTKRAAEHAMLTAVPPAAVRRPSMYSSSGTVAGNVESRLATYGAPETLAYTLGRTVPLEDIKVPDRYMKTTNQQNYVEQPQVRTAGLGPSPTDYTNVACISYYQYLCTPNCADRATEGPFLSSLTILVHTSACRRLWTPPPPSPRDTSPLRPRRTSATAPPSRPSTTRHTSRLRSRRGPKAPAARSHATPGRRATRTASPSLWMSMHAGRRSWPACR